MPVAPTRAPRAALARLLLPHQAQVALGVALRLALGLVPALPKRARPLSSVRPVSHLNMSCFVVELNIASFHHFFLLPLLTTGAAQPLVSAS